MDTSRFYSILNQSPIELIEWTANEFEIHLPNKISSADDMEYASELLLKLTAYHAYLCEFLSYTKIIVRSAKRNLSKTEWEDLVDKQNIIDRRLDIVKQQYAALSRAVTIHTENNKELFMTNE